MEQIKAMLEAMEKDAVFGEEMQALMMGGNVSDIIVLAAKKGFVFTEADWQTYIDWSSKLPAKQLAPEDLEQISGGAEILPPIYGGSGGCWFYASGESRFTDGAMRRRCRQLACEAFVVKYFKIYHCSCHGTSRCINYWHYEEGCK